MARKPASLDDLDIHPRILAACRQSNLTDLGRILSLSAPDIERVTQLSLNDVKSLQKAIALKIFPQTARTSLQIYKDESKLTSLSSGCPVIDSFLRGGFRTAGITEIAGESAAGKTQLCMQLCLTCQLPTEQGGLDSGAVYICTEDVFPNKRLVQMAQRLTQRDKSCATIPFTDRIFIEHAADLEHLRFCVNKKLPMLLSHGSVRLIIIDSIAALFRCEFGASEAVQRAKQLSSFAAQLHNLASKYDVVVICVNQVTASMGQSGSHQQQQSTGNNVVPALGLSWANLVTSRLMLQRTSNAVLLGDQHIEANVRNMEVLFAPHLPNTICQFIIDADGLKGLQ